MFAFPEHMNSRCGGATVSLYHSRSDKDTTENEWAREKHFESPSVILRMF